MPLPRHATRSHVRLSGEGRGRHDDTALRVRLAHLRPRVGSSIDEQFHEPQVQDEAELLVLAAQERPLRGRYGRHLAHFRRADASCAQQTKKLLRARGWRPFPRRKQKLDSVATQAG